MKKIIYSIIGIVTISISAFIFQSFKINKTFQTAETYMVTTFAGYSDNGTKKDGKGQKACFSRSIGHCTTDAEDNIYVLDENSLRKITPDGTVTSLLGEYVYNQDDNPLELQKLGFANGICIDKSGNIFISTGSNNSIKKIIGQKTIELYAGDDGFKGSSDGSAIGAGFDNPQGICMDKTGNIYVADANNYRVRKISADGKTVSTLVGEKETEGFKPGTGKAAGFREFRSIVADSKGNVYVYQNESTRSSCVVKITPAGVATMLAGDITKVVGEGKDGIGKAADFLRINALAIDAQDNIYVGENYRVRKVTAAGVVTTIAGANEPQWRDAVGSKARFANITGLATDSKGNIFVSDSYCIRKISKQ